MGKAVQFLREQNIKCAPKSENPPNTPEITCIDDFWGLIKGKVYKDGWERLFRFLFQELLLFKKIFCTSRIYLKKNSF